MLQHREAPFLFLTGFLKSSVKVDLKWTLSWEEGLSPFLLFVFFCFFLPPGSTSPLDRKATKNAWGKIWQHFFYQPFPDFYICFQRRESESDSLSVASDSLLSHRPAHQAPVSMGFPRQKNWSRLPFSSPGDLPDPGIGPVSPASQADVLPFSIKNPDIITEIQEHM